MNPDGSRADLHCHSTASQISKLGVQRSAGLPECATPPEEVYELAKRRGMDFVTITDHDTIDGALEIADRPDVFISEELTASFAGEPQAVHVLCFDITPDDHEWLQAHAGDVEECAEYLHGNRIACALAHPFYPPAAPLEPRHRRRLARLFEVWETRNGSRAHELNMPAAVYIDTHGGIGVGGSDDHAGVDIGRTFTRTPHAPTVEAFLDHIRAGRAEADGKQGSAAKWTHAAIALATRSIMRDRSAGESPAPTSVLKLLERVVGEGTDRSGADGNDFTRADARALLTAWLDSVGLPSGPALIRAMQDEDFSHSSLFRRSRTAHDSRLRMTADKIRTEVNAGGMPSPDVLTDLFDACMPVVPYLPSIAFLANERARLNVRTDEPRRVALVVDGIDGPHGVSHTIERIRELGVPGFDVDVIGTDSGVDQRLSAVAELEMPFYEGLRLGIPSLPGLVETLTEGRYDLMHVATPGPAGVAAALTSKIAAIPLLASHHTEFVAYARMRTGNEMMAGAMAYAMSVFYRDCGIVLSPSTSADNSLDGLGVPVERVARWVRGCDINRFTPGLRQRPLELAADGRISVLYAGRQTREKGVELLADAFLVAHSRDPRLRLTLAGGGPEQGYLRERLGNAAEFLGWLEGDDLARAYADADAFLFPSETDTYGQVVVEAQASGVPVVAVRAGGPADLIDEGRSGLLCEPNADEIAAKLMRLNESPALRQRLIRGGLVAAGERSWGAALAQLADGYSLLLAREAALADPEPLSTALAAA